MQLLQSKRRASLLETDSLRRQFQGEDPATSIQQPKQHGLYLEEHDNHGSHHAAQEYEQQLHEKQQQQQLQGRQQRTLQQEQQQQQQEADEQLGAPVAKVPLLTIAAMTAAMASMSGLGAVPYFFVGTMPAAWSGLANAVACGVMVVSCRSCAAAADAAAHCHWLLPVHRLSLCVATTSGASTCLLCSASQPSSRLYASLDPSPALPHLPILNSTLHAQHLTHTHPPNHPALCAAQAASFGLIQEGGQHSGLLSVAGVLLGALFISASKAWLDQHEDVSFEDFKGADAKKIVLIIGVMAAHAVGEWPVVKKMPVVAWQGAQDKGAGLVESCASRHEQQCVVCGAMLVAIEL